MNTDRNEAAGRPSSRVTTWAMVAYACTLAVSSIICLMAAVLVFVPVGESQEAAGIVWAWSIPAMIALSALSCFVYPTFRRATTTIRTSVIYLANLAAVAISGPGLVYTVIALMRSVDHQVLLALAPMIGCTVVVPLLRDRAAWYWGSLAVFVATVIAVALWRGEPPHLQRNSAFTELRSEAQQLVEAEDVALYVGRWHLNGSDPAGNAVVMSGESTDVLRRREGRWLIALDNPWGTEILGPR